MIKTLIWDMGDLCQISGPAIDSSVTWGKAISTSVISLPDCKKDGIDFACLQEYIA